MTEAYWSIGRLIVEEEQKGNERATYGEWLIKELSHRLSEEYGKGFSKRNLHSMEKFYQTFPIVQTLSAQLESLFAYTQSRDKGDEVQLNISFGK